MMATHLHRVGAILVIARHDGNDGNDVGNVDGKGNAHRDDNVGRGEAVASIDQCTLSSQATASPLRRSSRHGGVHGQSRHRQ